MLRVAIIDDEAISKRGIRQLLESRHEQFTIVGEASDGLEGLRLVQEQLPDIVITDIKMPHMDGLEMLHNINEISKNIKTVIISGHNNFEFAQRAIRMGAIDYVLKPVRIKEFLTLLDRIVKMYDQQDPSIEMEKGGTYRLVIQKSLDYIHKNYNTSLSLRDIADRANMNSSYFSKLFKTETGVNYQEYVLRYRVEKAKFYLKNTSIKINEIAKLVGYNDEKYFYVIFKRTVGCTPVAYRESRSRTKFSSEVPESIE